MADPNNSKEVLEAIASLWKLVAAIAVIIVAIILRPVLLRLRRVKKGDNEVEIDSPEKKSIAEVPSIAETKPAEGQPSTPSTQELAEKKTPAQSDLMKAIFNRDRTKAETILKELISAEPDKKQSHEVLYNALLCDVLKDADAKDILIKYLENPSYTDSKKLILFTLAQHAESLEQPGKANEYYDRIIAELPDLDDKAYAWVAKARILSNQDKLSEALNMLIDQVRSNPTDSTREIYFKEIAEVHKALGNIEEHAIALEIAASINPGSYNLLFKAAYAESQANLPLLAYLNYNLELDANPGNSMARNNLAVQLGEFNLPILAIDSYKRSQSDGNTLAAANIANALLEKGFAELAESILLEARQKPNYHTNVDHAIVSLSTKKESESSKKEKLEKASSRFKLFTKGYGYALLIPNTLVVNLSGAWSFPSGSNVKISQNGSTILCEWGTQWSRRKIEASIINRALRGKYFEEQLPFSIHPAEINYGAGVDLLGYFNPEQNKLYFIPKSDIDKPTIELTRV